LTCEALLSYLHPVMPRKRAARRLLGLLALALLALVGWELAEAACHTHPAAVSCGPCRVLALCSGADVPVPAIAISVEASHFAVTAADSAPESRTASSPTDGRAPPSRG
jgi:hypothetical protein